MLERHVAKHDETVTISAHQEEQKDNMMGPPAIMIAANVVAPQCATEKPKFTEKLSNYFCADMGLAQ